MRKVGDKDIVFSETFILQPNDGAGGVAEVNKVSVGIVLNFKSSFPAFIPKYDFEIKGTIIHFEFTNWVNAATKHPVHIGKVGDTPIGFMITHQLVVEVELTNLRPMACSLLGSG